jgi:hypothetical protein
VFDTPANYERRYNLPGIGSNDEEPANLELAGPKGPRRIVDETAGEVTFTEQLLRIQAHELQKYLTLYSTDHVVIFGVGTLTNSA